MEQNKVIKEKSKFVDNIAYKSKFQFLIWVNENVICQRYFKINGFNEDSIYSAEFIDCMNGIVRSIQEDLESKSRVYLWYTNTAQPFKLRGFFTIEEGEKYGEEFVRAMCNDEITGKVQASDGKIFTKEYISMSDKAQNDFGETQRPSDGEITFKFSFLIDDKPVFEKIWDGNVYPKFVRNGVDLTNSYASKDNHDISSLSFNAAIIRYMQRGKNNLISEFIRRICDTLSNTFTEKYEYTKEFEMGGKKYNYLSAYESYKNSWRKAVRKKTQEYYETLYPSPRQIAYIEKHY